MTLRNLAIALGAMFFLSSCLDLEAKVSVDTGGATRFSYTAEVPKLVVALAALEPGDRLIPLPLDRDILAEELAQREGSLVSFDRKETEDEIVVTAELEFPSPAALAAFIDPSGANARYTEEGTTHRLSVLLAEGRNLDPDLEHFIDAAFAGRRIRISVDFPKAVKDNGIAKAQGSGGRGLAFDEAATTLMKRQEPLWWELSW